jgi:Fic family protein
MFNDSQEINMTWLPDQPYNQLPALPPKRDLESIRTLKACIAARAALAALKQAGELLPNQSILINLLPLLEAKDSSEIENIVTTSDQLFQHATEDSQADGPTKEALRYRTALHQGFQALSKRPLTTNTMVEVCSTIKGRPMHIRQGSGVALGNPATGQITYTPPEGERTLREQLANWETFIHTDDTLDPLIKMAVAHYQFEAIHPFDDGNGRTGRILNLLYLIEQKLLSLPILYLSRYILQNKADYYRRLLAVTSDDAWEDWICYMLEAVAQTATWTLEKITAARDLFAHTRDTIRQQLPKIYSHELLELIFEQPYCRIQNLVERDIAKRQTASVYLKQLCDIGVLKEQSAGKEKLFVHPKLIHLMTQPAHTFKPYAG